MKRLSLALVSLLVVSLPVAAKDNPAAVKRAIETELGRYRQAVLAKDAELALRMFTDDFTTSLPDGGQRRTADCARDLRQFIKETKSITNWTMTVSPVKFEGKKAIVEVRESFSRTIVTPGGSQQTQVEKSRLRDRWVKVTKGKTSTWKLEWIDLKERFVVRDPRPAVALLTKRYEFFRQACVARDVARATLIWDRKYQEEYPNGLMLQRGQAEAFLAKTLNGIVGTPKWKITIDQKKGADGKSAYDLILRDDVMVVRRTDHVVANGRGPKGKTVPQTIIQTYRDTWVNSSEGWKWRYSETVSAKNIIGGKTIYPFGRPKSETKAAAKH